MSKEKKDALTLACEHDAIHQDHTTISCRLCDCYKEGICNPKTDLKICSQKLKEYFIKHSDIPDGWDVIKNKLKELRKINAAFHNGITGISPEEAYGIDVLEELCNEYGIEV